MPDSTLVAIRQKVRRLTRNPSTAQISDAQIDEYVNTFISYDFPEHLRLFSLRTTLTFYTKPNIDTYETSAVATDPLFNFKDKYTSIHDPVFVAGIRSLLTQSREQFYSIYPNARGISSIGTGDGVSTAFGGTLTNIPVLRSNVLFSAVDINGNGLAVRDDGAGLLVGDIGAGPNVINYVTGVYAFVFATAPAAGSVVYSQTVSYVASRPQAILFYQNKFIVRPVPDQPYPIEVEAYLRPSELLAAGSSPDLEQWWQYIAYGSSKKIFEDRMDMDSIQMILPEFKMQERMVLRKTLAQLSNERSGTIYTHTSGYGMGGSLNSNTF